MELIRLSPQNAYEYIGYEILFKSRGKHIVKKILSVSNTSVKIDHPDLHNQLQIISRKVYVLIELNSVLNVQRCNKLHNI